MRQILNEFLHLFEFVVFIVHGSNLSFDFDIELHRNLVLFEYCVEELQLIVIYLLIIVILLNDRGKGSTREGKSNASAKHYNNAQYLFKL